jgi:hypothetical protein
MLTKLTANGRCALPLVRVVEVVGGGGGGGGVYVCACVYVCVCVGMHCSLQ